MFDFDIEMMLRGFPEIEINGEKWISIKSLIGGHHIAVKASDPIPAQIFLVKEDEKKNDKTNKI